MTERDNTNYTPISCSYYDELEALATTREQCSITFTEKSIETTVTDTITDLKIIDKAEYMLLKSGNRIRLDQIISVNDKHLSDAKYCVINQPKTAEK